MKKYISYDEAFQAFLKQTNEKPATAAALADFFSAFAAQKGFEEKRGKNLRVLDIGCGEGHFAASFIRAVARAHDGGFEYRGFDVSDEFVRNTKSCVGAIPAVKSCETLKTGDAFADSRLFDGKQDLVLVSHALYYLPETGLASFLKAARDGLAENGMIFSLHQSNDIDWARIAAKHGKNMRDYTDLVADATARNAVPLVEIPLYATVTLPTLSAEQRQLFRESLRKQETSSDPAVRQLSQMFSFLAAEPETDAAGNLVVPEFVSSAFAEDMLALADRSNGRFYTLSKLQIIPAAGMAAATAVSKLEEAAATLKVQYPVPAIR